MKNLKDWLQPSPQLNKNMVLQILMALLSTDDNKPLKVKVDQAVTVKEEKPKQIFDNPKEIYALKFLPKKSDQ